MATPKCPECSGDSWLRDAAHEVTHEWQGDHWELMFAREMHEPSITYKCGDCGYVPAGAALIDSISELSE